VERFFAHQRITAGSICLCIFLGGCTEPAVVPVREYNTQSTQPKVHIVRKGDTLYSIAWDARTDFRSLAQWNGISKPYFIQPGQKIRLTQPRHTVKSTTVVKPSITTNTKQRNQQRQPTKTVPKSSSKKTPYTSKARVKTWIWPANGRVIRKFSPKTGSSGIDIMGKIGTPIRASAAGRVVYAGNGLRGYGNLVIIKHNQSYLSAYAHHRRILVKQGRYVKQGQKIAEMGSSGSNQVKLHFEIRRNGNPTDPLRYISK
jgi:lipoprotein NlpD